MSIEDMIDEVVSEKKKEIDDKFDEISVINMIDFNEPMNLKTWDWLNGDTSLFNELGSRNIATEVVKKIFPEATNAYNDVNIVTFRIEEFLCGISKLGNGLQADTEWYQKIEPLSYDTWFYRNKDYMMDSYIRYVKEYLEIKKPAIPDKVKLYLRDRYYRKSICNYFTYIFAHKAIKKVTDRAYLEGIMEQCQAAYEEYLKECNRKNKELDERLLVFQTKVIPVLERLSGNIGEMSAYNSVKKIPTVKELREMIIKESED